MFFISKKINIVEAGWLQGFSDIHCHLIPAVDDGVKTVAESIETMELMQSMGIKRIVTTPHLYTLYPENNSDSLLQAYSQLQEQLPPGLPPLFLGAEHMVDQGLTQHLEHPTRLTIGESRYFLVEFSFANPPMGYMTHLSSIRFSGVEPLLAHPERYLYLTRKEYHAMKDLGYAFQLNLFSLTGMYGPDVAKRAEKLFADGVYDFVGTDTHNPRALGRVIVNARLSTKYETKLRSLMQRNEQLFEPLQTN